MCGSKKKATGMLSGMLRKFVYVTGAMDYLVGFSTGAFGLLSTDPQQVPALVTLGAFLCFAAASLMWASHDLATRGCVVVWQGLVRLSAVLSLLLAMKAGIVPAMVELYGADPAGVTGGLIGVCVFDGFISMVYLIGTSRMEGHSFVGLLRGQPAKT